MKQYNPARPPSSKLETPESLADWAEQEMQQVGNSLITNQDFDLLGIEPQQPENGMIRMADGVGWDPGYGGGMYFYRNGEWIPMFEKPTVVQQGGVTMSAANTGPANDITGTPGTVAGYDPIVGDAIACSADPANGTITFQETGYWLIGFQFAVDIASSALNEAREVAARFYDVDADVATATIGFSVIPRYGETITLAGTVRVGFTPDNVGERFAVQVWSPTDDVIPVLNVVSAQYWCARVSNSSIYPGAPAFQGAQVAGTRRRRVV